MHRRFSFRSFPFGPGALLATALIAGVVSGSALADEPSAETTPGSDAKQQDAQLSRFVEANPASPRAEEAPATCQAPAREAANREALNRVEQQVSEARAAQERRWAEKGWRSPADAAAADEPVALNGRGYNYRSHPRVSR